MPGFSETRGGFHGGFNFNRGICGIFWGRFKVQYQICFKYGHDVRICYHKHLSMMPIIWNNYLNIHMQMPKCNLWPNSHIQIMPIASLNQWLTPSLRGHPPGFAQRHVYQPQAYLIGIGRKTSSAFNQHTYSWCNAPTYYLNFF